MKHRNRAGKNPEFKECGLKIKLLGGNMSKVNTDNKKVFVLIRILSMRLKFVSAKKTVRFAVCTQCKMQV